MERRYAKPAKRADARDFAGMLRFLFTGDSGLALNTIAKELKVGIGILLTNGRPLEDCDRIGFCDFCDLVRETESGRKMCTCSDKSRIAAAREKTDEIDDLLSKAENARMRGDSVKADRISVKARNLLRSHFTCDLGLLDLCYPLKVHNEVAGYMFFGQIRYLDIQEDQCRKLLERPVPTKDPTLISEWQSKLICRYYSIPRRNGEEVSFYRLLRQFAGLFSAILGDRHVLDHAVRLTNSSTPLKDTRHVLAMLLQHSPAKDDACIQIWLKEPSDAVVVESKGRPENGKDSTAGDDGVDACRSAMLRHLPQPFVCYPEELFQTQPTTDRGAPSWIGYLEKAPGQKPIDGIKAREHLEKVNESAAPSAWAARALEELPSKPLLLSPLHVEKGVSLGSIVVTWNDEQVPEKKVEEMKRWMQIASPLIAATVRRHVEHIFLQTIYSTRNLLSLARIVQAGLPAVLRIGYGGACTVFHVRDLEDAETHKKEQVLVPADIESVVAGEGTVNDPADGPKELFYRWEQGETGWLWARGQWFFDEKLAFQLRDNTKPDKSFDEFRKALPPGKSVPASFTSPKWEGKVRAKDERDPDKPKTVAILPIVDAGMVIGLLRIVRPTDTGLFDEDEVSLLYAVAAHVATVIRVTNAADYGAKASLQPVMWQMHEMMREIRTFIEAARKPSKGNANLENKLGIIDKHYAWFRAVKAAGDLLTGQEQISSIEQLPKRLERFGLIGSPVEIGDLLNEAKDRSVRVIDTERTKVKLHLPKNGWPAVTVYGEREALLTVFTETIRNAIEHKRDEYGDQSSKVAIGIEADVVSDPDFVKIVIRDDAPMLHDAIVIGLQEIQRQPEGAQLPCRGWGLISNTLVLMIHGGSIAVRPTPGTKYEKQFEITLPIHRA